MESCLYDNLKELETMINQSENVDGNYLNGAIFITVMLKSKLPVSSRFSWDETLVSSRENHWSGKIDINFYGSPMVTGTFANVNNKTTLMSSVKHESKLQYVLLKPKHKSCKLAKFHF